MPHFMGKGATERTAPACAVLRGAALAACASLAMVRHGSVQAAEWAAEPSVRFQAQYDDNVHLSTVPHDTVLGMFVVPEIKLSQRTEISELSFGGRLESRRYPGDSELDSDSQDMLLAGSYQTERSTWQWKSQVRRAATLITEVTDTGLLSSDRKREDMTITPSWKYAISPKASVQLAYSFADTSYEDGADGLVGYRFQVLSGTVFRQISERNQLNMELRASRFEAPDIGTETDSYEVLAGIDGRIAETLRGSLQVGALWSSSSRELHFGSLTLAQESTATGALLNAQVEKDFELTRLAVGLKRLLMPSGSGQLNLSDQVSVQMRRKLAPTVEAVIEASGLRNRATEGDSATDREAYSVQPSLFWRLDNWWRLGASYGYAWQKYDNAQESASSNRFIVTLSYTWPRAAVAR